MLTKFWDNLTTEDISRLSRNVILIAPFSSIEQHGSHLPLNTDRVILDKILQKLSLSKNLIYNNGFFIGGLIGLTFSYLKCPIPLTQILILHN